MLNNAPPLPGFTIWRTENHGQTFSGATVSERVHGHIETTMIVAILPRDIAEAIRMKITRSCAIPHLAYWIEAVESFGQMSPYDTAPVT